MASVTIGGNQVILAPFSAAKAMEAAELVTEIVQAGDGLIAAMDAYARRHIEQNTTRVPRAAAHYQDPESAGQVPEAAWAASGNVLEVPGPAPVFEQQLLGVWPDVFRAARGPVLSLLALVLVSERDLEQADERGGPDGIRELLERERRELLYRARMEELVALASTAWEVCREQLAADPTALALLGRLMALRGTSRPRPPRRPSPTHPPTRVRVRMDPPRRPLPHPVARAPSPQRATPRPRAPRTADRDGHQPRHHRLHPRRRPDGRVGGRPTPARRSSRPRRLGTSWSTSGTSPRAWTRSSTSPASPSSTGHTTAPS